MSEFMSEPTGQFLSRDDMSTIELCAMLEGDSINKQERQAQIDRIALLSHITALEQLVEKMAAVYVAERLASELENKALDHAEYAEACGYANDATGSLHVSESQRNRNNAWLAVENAINSALSSYDQYKKVRGE